ncbi:MAG: lamin tail domain-containing protein [Planctomycetes bacterium]|nr:lamin tail domain-containing protein [Planctomycetota bacterium]
MRIFTTLILLSALPCTAQSPIVINELAWDDTGTDDREFVELMATGTVPLDISGWELRFSSGASTTSFYVPAATILLPGQFYVIGNAWSAPDMLVPPSSFPNTSRVVTIRDQTGTVYDSVGYEGYFAVISGEQIEGDPIFADFVSTDNHETSYARVQNGLDTDWNSIDFRLARATPKQPNNTGTQPLVSVKQNADTLTVGQPIPGWEHSGPTAPTAQLPTVPGTSPQGGNVLSFPIGAGSSFWFNSDAQDGTLIRTWVYLDVPTLTTGQMSAWSIGVRGFSGSTYGRPDPLWTGNDTNGDTGVAWTFVATAAGAELFLIDNNDGGRDHVLLMQQHIASSGWHLLGLDVAGNRCVATLDNNCYHFPVSFGKGTVYVGGGSYSGAPAQTLYLDDVCLVDRPEQVSPIGLGCQGNCTQQNFSADLLDSEPTRTQATGTRYAALITPLGTTKYMQFCLLGGSRTTQPSGTTITLRAVNSNGSPGAVLLDGNGAAMANMPMFFHDSSGPLTNKMGPGWWAADLMRVVSGQKTAFVRSAPFFAEWNHDADSYLPVAQPSSGPIQSVAWSSLNGSPWTPMASAMNWAFAAVCDDDAGVVKALSDSEITPGSTLRLAMGGGAGTDPAIGAFALGVGFLGLAQVTIPLTVFGMPGCTAYTNPVASVVMPTDALGMAQLAVPLPNTPAIIGLILYSQWVASDPGINPAGMLTSSALVILIL